MSGYRGNRHDGSVLKPICHNNTLLSEFINIVCVLFYVLGILIVIILFLCVYIICSVHTVIMYKVLYLYCVC